MADTAPSARSTAPATALSFHGIRRRFGRLRVLDGVSGQVGPGEVLLVTGRNGSGKSTLVKILAALLAPEAGTVEYRLDGRDLDRVARRRAVGYVAPDLSFYEELTTAENLELFCRLRGVDPARGGELLDRVGLPHRRPSGALSSGMRQRLRWTFALLARPRLLLLDEPFQNFDQPGIDQGIELLGEHLAGGGLAVVANPGHLDVGVPVAHRLELA
jgi:heme exporter protein A